MDNAGSLLDELFSGSSVVDSPLSAFAPGVDCLVGVTLIPWVPPLGPDPPLVSPLHREPAVLEDGFFETAL